MFKVGFKAGFVFLFMAFLAAQAATGFMRTLFAGRIYPRAMRAFDWLLDTLVIGPLGQTGGAIALLLFGLAFSILVWRRGNKGARKMSGKVWISGVLNPSGIGEKQGTRTKFYNHDWNPASFNIPVEPDEVYSAYRRHRQGFALQRSEFPEAIAVFDESRFAKAKDIFTAGPFLAVKGKLAEVLSRFDLGDGGLIPFIIYKADLVTPIDGKFFLLNFGARKRSFLPEISRNAEKLAVDRKTGTQIWTVNPWCDDQDVALLPAALDGADIWFEETVLNSFFMSDRLALALIDIGMKDVFKLKECRIAGAG